MPGQTNSFQPFPKHSVEIIVSLNPPNLTAIRRACLLLILAVLAALWAQLPHLAVEARRFQPWQLLGLWFADLSALLWFIRFATVHALLGRPLESPPLGGSVIHFKTNALLIYAAILLDLTFTFYLMYDERRSYYSAAVTQAEVLRVGVQTRQKATWYKVECRFTTDAGVPQRVHLSVQAENHVLPAGLSVETSDILTQRRAGEKIRIRYDRNNPARAWVQGSTWNSGNELYWISLMVLFFQAIATIPFVGLLYNSAAKGRLPWWFDTYKVLPLVIEAFWMFLFGMIDWMIDSFPS